MKLFKEKTIQALATALLISLMVSGCAVGRKYRPPQNPAQGETGFHQESSRYDSDEPVIAWWRELQDDELSRLVELALSNNLDLQIAVTQVAKARAIVTETGADRLPTVDSSASYARQRLSEDGVGGPAFERTISLYDAGFDAFWELDLFGRVTHRVKRARALSRQAEADLRAVKVTVAAETARAYIELRGAQYRLDIAQRNADNQAKTLDITDQKSSGGQSTSLDVARARTQLESTRARLPQLEAAVSRSIRRLSVLTGSLPHTLEEELREMRPLPSVPQTVRIGDPQTLLERRPDIQRAREAAAAALAEYNLAFNELFPEISFHGAVGFTATKFSEWFSAGALRASTGPTLSWRILDLTRILARMKQEDQDAQASVKEYYQTVLEALEETANALTDFSKEEQRRVNLYEAARSSVEASKLANSRFKAGLDDFLDLLDTERTQLDAEDALAVSEIATALHLVAIYKALGGGWEFTAERIEE